MGRRGIAECSWNNNIIIIIITIIMRKYDAVILLPHMF